jgi:hypothetical protein
VLDPEAYDEWIQRPHVSETVMVLQGKHVTLVLISRMLDGNWQDVMLRVLLVADSALTCVELTHLGKVNHAQLLKQQSEWLVFVHRGSSIALTILPSHGA